jgi:hypothetical protein
MKKKNLQYSESDTCKICIHANLTYRENPGAEHFCNDFPALQKAHVLCAIVSKIRK